MRQFYETYQGDEKVAALVRQLSWTHNLIILGQSKRPEEREFYLRQAIQENWSKRELERQFKTALFERTVLSPPKVSPVVTQTYPRSPARLDKQKTAPRRAGCGNRKWHCLRRCWTGVEPRGSARGT
jgi:hypothetical protein